jgi:hypothetical protein
MALIPIDRWYERGSLTEPPTVKPFVLLAGAGTIPGIGPVRRRSYEFWVHDERGTYDTINFVIENLAQFLDRNSFQTSFGYAQAFEYMGESPDLEDVDFRTNVRSLTMRLIGRPR